MCFKDRSKGINNPNLHKQSNIPIEQEKQHSTKGLS